MKRFAAILVFVFGIVLNYSPGIAQVETYSSYEQYYDAVNELEGRGEYDEALKLVQGVWGQFPERRFDLSRELLYLYRKTEQYERWGLTVWEKGHRQGFFYMIIPTMKQYEPFAGFDKFAAIAEEDKRLREAALEKSQTIFEVVLPQGYSEKETYPLLIVLHGGGSNIERAKKHWHSPLLGEKYIVVFIRSYLHYDSETFGWKVFDPRAREDIRRCFDEIAAQYRVDTARGNYRRHLRRGDGGHRHDVQPSNSRSWFYRCLPRQAPGV